MAVFTLNQRSNTLCLVFLSISILLKCASGIDFNSLIPRLNCYPTEQPGCDNKDFVDEYPELQYGYTNLTKAETWFFLFTRDNPDKPELLHKCAGDLPPETKFKLGKRLIVVLMPFNLAICTVAIYREWVTQYLMREDCNILAVDYSWGNSGDYITATMNIKVVAKQTKIVLEKIAERTNLKSDDIYVIGHSLGAQLAGLIGHIFPVYRITGVDPAQPGYAEDIPPEDRLDKSDAVLVDVWHTNAGCLPNSGLMYDAGHVDYYVNDFRKQPSCYGYALTSIAKGDLVFGIRTAASRTSCWHNQAAVFYKVTINPGDCQFVGVRCPSYWHLKNGYCNSCGINNENCTIMGFDLDKIYDKDGHKPSGKFLVKTSFKCPYCDNSCIQLEGFKSTYNSLLQTKRTEERKSCDYKNTCIGGSCS